MAFYLCELRESADLYPNETCGCCAFYDRTQAKLWEQDSIPLGEEAPGSVLSLPYAFQALYYTRTHKVAHFLPTLGRSSGGRGGG